MSKRKTKPHWMPVYVTQFLADTAHLTVAQVGAYINLLCAMWNTRDGTLPNDKGVLARASRVKPQHWARIWKGIKPLVDVDGELVTSAELQSELGKANAIIVSRRAVGSLGGQTTKFNRDLKSYHSGREPLKPPEPLKDNDAGAANGAPNYNYNIKEEKEERSGSTRPETVEPSLKEKEATREKVLEPLTSQPNSAPPGNHSPEMAERMATMKNWGQNLYRRR